jgi:hypothetical protein
MIPTTPSRPLRVLYAIPLLGRIAREIAQDTDNALYAVVILFTLLVLAALKWGVVVFTLAALCVVPLIFVFFVVICWPFPKGR